MAFNIFMSQQEDKSYITWDSPDAYSWVLLDNRLIAAAITEKELTINQIEPGEALRIITDNSDTLDWTLYANDGDTIKTQILVTFNAVATAVKYRILINGAVDGEIADNGASRYTFYSSHIESDGSYSVDVEWRDNPGNWSPTAHQYTLYMYVVPAGQNYTVSKGPVAGQLTFTAA